MSTSGKFTKLDKLGEGTYGVVYKAREKASGEVFALKRMNIAADEEGVPATTIREICLLKELHHPNIVRLHDVMFQAPKLTLVFEHCDYDLKKYMDLKHNKLDPETEVKHFMRQLLLGLAHMHTRSVVHRDLKPQNLLINDNKDLKLADFGLARVEGIPVKKYSHEAVTLWYRPPDVIMGSANYGLAVDMWSMGCIFAEMATGHALFTGKTDHEQLVRMYKLIGSPTKEVWPGMTACPLYKTLMERPELQQRYPSTLDEYCAQPAMKALGPHGIELFRHMLKHDPSDRITAVDALKHPYFGTSPTPAPASATSPAPAPAKALGGPPTVAATQPTKTPHPPTSPKGEPSTKTENDSVRAAASSGVDRGQPAHHDMGSSSAGLSSSGAPNGAKASGSTNAKMVVEHPIPARSPSRSTEKDAKQQASANGAVATPK